MRKPIIAGNWKMNKTRDEVINFALGVSGKLPVYAECVVCAPFVYLREKSTCKFRNWRTKHGLS